MLCGLSARKCFILLLTSSYVIFSGENSTFPIVSFSHLLSMLSLRWRLLSPPLACISQFNDVLFVTLLLANLPLLYNPIIFSQIHWFQRWRGVWLHIYNFISLPPIIFPALIITMFNQSMRKWYYLWLSFKSTREVEQLSWRFFLATFFLRPNFLHFPDTPHAWIDTT